MFYRLRATFVPIPLSGDALLFRSDTRSLRVDGEFAALLASRILPMLRGDSTIEEIAQALDLPVPSLRDNLDGLVNAGVLESDSEPMHGTVVDPQFNLVEALTIDPAEARARLDRARIGVFGLDGVGGIVAEQLLSTGFRHLSLVDPITPAVERDTASRLMSRFTNASLSLSGRQSLDREQVRDLAAGCDLLISCWDRGYESGNHWTNRASVELGIPALYCSLGGVQAFAGPFVVPGMAACYMCTRMRAVAAAEDYQQAMACEKFFDDFKQPTFRHREFFVSSLSILASLLATDAYKYIVLEYQPALLGQVIEFDPLTLEMNRHTILEQPQCPVCSQKKKLPRHHPGLAELLAARPGSGRSLGALSPELVSPRFGLVKDVVPLEGDPTEPGRPFVVQASLANHQFLPKEHAEQFSCSGKGFTMERAVEGALGEAVERYSASFWWNGEIKRCRRDELPGRSVDPGDFVLYDTTQYETLPYRPYAQSSTLGWVEAHSLTAEESVWVPALGVFLTYPCTEDEYLWPATSNGLAAGSTLDGAILSAALEVIERDAVMIGWLNRLCLDRWAPAPHPDPSIRQLVEAYRRRGIEIGLFRMPTDVGGVSVFLAIARDPERMPTVVVGLGCDFVPAAAAAKAICEVAQVRPALRRKLRQPETLARVRELIEDPRRVTSLHDHDLLYSHPDALSKLDFLFSLPVSVDTWQADEAPRDLGDLVAALRSAGHEVLYYNLSVPELEKRDLFSARAMIPQFQPIDFGWSERRLGGSRVYTLPVRLGLLAKPNTLDTLNPDPHPIA